MASINIPIPPNTASIDITFDPIVVAPTPPVPPVPPVPPAPPSTGKPDATNTGPKSTLTASGGITYSKAIANLDISGVLTINKPGALISNCRINGGGASSAVVLAGLTDATQVATLSDVEILNFKDQGVFNQRYHLIRANVHGSGADGLKANWDTTIQDTWIHDLGSTPGAHADGIQVTNGQNINFKNVVIDARKASGWNNSCIFINAENGGAVSGVVMDQMEFYGGNYAVYCQNQGGVTIKNSIFHTDTFQFGNINVAPGMPKPAMINCVDQNGHPVTN